MEQISERRLTKAEFGFVEQKLYNYPINKQIIAEYEAQRARLTHGKPRDTPHPEKGISQNQGIGKPTETTALQLVLLEQRVKCEAFWIRAIEDTLKLLSAEERRLVQLKYFEGYLTNEGIMLKMGIDRNMFYRMRADIITKFARRMTLL